jgi:GT2 family glycosyltransferase
MTIGVITLVAGRTDHLTRLLDGLSRQRRPADEIVVVDMAPHDPVVERCTTGRDRVRRLAMASAHASGLPLAEARNIGAAATACDLLVFLDVDCIPDPHLVACYEDGLHRRPDRLVCGPVRYLREGWREGCAECTPEELDAWSDPPPSRPRPLELTDSGSHELFWSLSFATTASTWSTIGGFDPAYVGYGAEDTDFAMRAKTLGVDLAWMSDGVAYHQWHPPSRLDPERLDELVANARRYRHRWGCWPMTGWLNELDRAGAVRFVPDRDVLEVRGCPA